MKVACGYEEIMPRIFMAEIPDFRFPHCLNWSAEMTPVKPTICFTWETPVYFKHSPAVISEVPRHYSHTSLAVILR